MEKVQIQFKDSGKTTTYTANDLSIYSIREYIEMCLKDFGVPENDSKN